MDKQLILSICIPTNGIVEWIIPVIESIYVQEVDNNLFEIVITDNGGKDDLEIALQAYEYPNLHYYKTNSQGFTNQIDAFEKCSGLFCKMLNHRSKMLPGSIEKMISIINKYKEDKPIIYCAEGYAKGGGIIECKNTDQFVKSLSYWVSWSAGTGAWKSDLVNLQEKVANKMFPHTLFLFCLRDESNYVIWNERYEKMAKDVGKGGYDFFHTFSVELLDFMSELRLSDRISKSTFVGFKKELFSYLCSFYYSDVVCPTKRTYIVKDVRESMMVYYSEYDYNKMVALCYFKRPLGIIKHALMKLLGKK
jgi:glycosyltransferase involved in cell wall biosynthesis